MSETAKIVELQGKLLRAAERERDLLKRTDELKAANSAFEAALAEVRAGASQVKWFTFDPSTQPALEPGWRLLGAAPVALNWGTVHMPNGEDFTTVYQVGALVVRDP